MTRARIYKPPYKRKPDPVTIAANALWDEARRQDLEEELRAMRAEQDDEDDGYEWGGSL